MTGFVYAIGDSERVKIGWSSDPMRRLDKIRSDCPDVAHLLGLVPATREQEAEAHKLLAPWHIQREWFRHEGAVTAFVEMLAQPRPRAERIKKPTTGVDSVIEALGGPTATAVIVGVRPSAICNWKTRGSIPPDKFMLLERALADRGKGKPSTHLFGFEPLSETPTS
jgi:hypothetical protein